MNFLPSSLDSGVGSQRLSAPEVSVGRAGQRQSYLVYDVASSSMFVFMDSHLKHCTDFAINKYIIGKLSSL